MTYGGPYDTLYDPDGKTMKGDDLTSPYNACVRGFPPLGGTGTSYGPGSIYTANSQQYGWGCNHRPGSQLLLHHVSYRETVGYPTSTTKPTLENFDSSSIFTSSIVGTHKESGQNASIPRTSEIVAKRESDLEWDDEIQQWRWRKQLNKTTWFYVYLFDPIPEEDLCPPGTTWHPENGTCYPDEGWEWDGEGYVDRREIPGLPGFPNDGINIILEPCELQPLYEPCFSYENEGE